ncbi:MAG TPA: HindIII family type II restriction endonuclease [Syntrophorhabdaceae bacterium]|nr:HindIII family type II restriction endonuclease [Syntrophorhabdaceae bacterium]
MKYEIITQDQIDQRSYWVDEISRLSGNFGVDAEKVENEINAEIAKVGIAAILGHLRLCGAIPERYGHDTSEEKLYSKYTDVVIHEAFSAMGLQSLVLKTRADVADVECVAKDYSFVADAKAFRLSRTAKNQKDFKVQAMDGWKHGKPYAIVVCPVYQLPSRSSQIYQQAATRSVCVGTYSHLAVLVQYAELVSQSKAIELLRQLFISVESMNPSKDAPAYWQTLNRTMLGFDKKVSDLWREEKKASAESVNISREESLRFLASERERIMKMSKDQAISEILKSSKIDGKIRAVQSVCDNGLFGMV